MFVFLSLSYVLFLLKYDVDVSSVSTIQERKHVFSLGFVQVKREKKLSLAVCYRKIKVFKKNLEEKDDFSITLSLSERINVPTQLKTHIDNNYITL